MTTLEEDLIHPGEDELVRLMDSQLSNPERAKVRSHIDDCHICSERLDELEGISGWLHSHVGELDGGLRTNEVARMKALRAVRIAGRTRAAERSLLKQAWFRAAAAIVLLIGGGLVVTPVWAWLLNLRAPEVAEAPLPAAPVEALPAADAGATLSFRPVTASFSIELASPQAAGSVAIGVSPTGQASAQILGGTEESVMILPSGLRIENSPGSTATYRILLPASLIRQFEVTAGGQVLLRDALESGTGETIVSLAGATAAQ